MIGHKSQKRKEKYYEWSETDLVKTMFDVPVSKLGNQRCFWYQMVSVLAKPISSGQKGCAKASKGHVKTNHYRWW